MSEEFDSSDEETKRNYGMHLCVNATHHTFLKLVFGPHRFWSREQRPQDHEVR